MTFIVVGKGCAPFLSPFLERRKAMLTKDSPIAEIEAETERLKKLLSDNGYKVSECVQVSFTIEREEINISLFPTIDYVLGRAKAAPTTQPQAEQ